MRRLRFPLAVAAVILITGTVAGLLQRHTGPRYLDPHDAGPFGTRALAQILANRGERFTAVSSVGQAERATTADATLVVTNPAFLNARQLATLGRLPGDRLIIEPDVPAVRVLAPGVAAGGPAAVTAHKPACGLDAARLAGNADTGGMTFRAPVAAQRCYPAPARPSLVRYGLSGRAVTVVGTGRPFVNSDLADLGNAALALNLLAGKPDVVWLTPAPAVAGHTSLTSLIPLGAYLVAIQLTVAVVVTAAWRARRLGPIVSEPLPVVVHAAETVEGHGRLYQSRHARDRAAEALRTAAVERIAARMRLRAEPAAVTAAVAARTGADPASVQAALYGPAPTTDRALVELASTLDTLESEVT